MTDAKEAQKDPYLFGLPDEAKNWTIKEIERVLEETEIKID